MQYPYDKGLNLSGENKMPNGNRTGPRGDGPLTGRGLGACGTNSNIIRGFGNGLGNGRGLGGRFRNVVSSVFQQSTSKNEKQILEEELNEINQVESNLKNQKELIKKKLDEMDN